MLPLVRHGAPVVSRDRAASEWELDPEWSRETPDVLTVVPV